MYFVRYQPLKDKLSARTLSDREALPYLVLFCASTALVWAFPMIEEFNGWDLVSGILSVSFAIAGVFYAYAQNGKETGFDLIQKFVVLGWVVTIRFLMVFIPAAIVAYITGDMLGIVGDATNWFDVMLIAGGEIVVYQRIGRHIRDTRSYGSEQAGGANALPHVAHP